MTEETGNVIMIEESIEKFYNNIDLEFSKQEIEKLMSFESCKGMGFRLAGSTSELAAAQHLYETFMDIGLKNVVKDEVTVDSFEFKGAKLRFRDAGGRSCESKIAAFPTAYQASDEEAEVIYVGKGIESDYRDIDVSGKIALIDIDQMNEWWINWPAYQAKLKGARAVIAVNTQGFCSYSEDTVGLQDYCGPADAPAFSMSVRDANVLKAAIGGKGRSLPVKLDAYAKVTHDRPAYNIVGEIPGSGSGTISYIAHYDAYFRSFNDNSSGVACMLGIARAIINSGYQPAKTFRIIAHCAEEWGIDNSRHDWARGAQLETEKHPEWARDGFAVINLDCGLISGKANAVLNRTQYEMADIVKEIGAKVKGNTIGPVKVESPSWTWSENYAYTKLGIPVIDDGIEGDDEMPHYHSNSDTKEANNYSDDVYLASHRIYGAYALYLDAMKVRPFDFAKTFSALEQSLDSRNIKRLDDLSEELRLACKASRQLKENAHRNFSDEEAEKFNVITNRIFKLVANRLFGIDWNEDNDFIHVHKQTNVSLLEAAVHCLENGDAKTVLDECLLKIDLNWYAYSFDKETCDFFVDQVLAPDAKNSWGTGITDNVGLWNVIRSLQTKLGDPAANFSTEISVLKNEMAGQQKRLDSIVDNEILDIHEITELIRAAADI